MKVAAVNSYLDLSRKSYQTNQDNKSISAVSVKQNPANPTFKSLGMSMLGISSFLMQWIESKGYLISFLIQDGVGMIALCVWTGFHRDQEITGS